MRPRTLSPARRLMLTMLFNAPEAHPTAGGLSEFTLSVTYGGRSGSWREPLFGLYRAGFVVRVAGGRLRLTEAGYADAAARAREVTS